MAPHYPGLVCALIALAGFALAHHYAGKLPAARRWRWLAISAAAALPALYNASYYLHILPEASWFYEARSWPGMELWVIPAGIAGGLLAACLPRKILILPLLVTVGITWGPFLKPVLGPLPTRGFRDVWTRDVCIQSTLATCGPASAATVLRSFGIARGEREIARAAHSYLGGTEAWYLARYLRDQGMSARFVVGAGGFPQTLRLPAIVGVTLEGRGHFIPVLARNGDAFVIGDPMVGRETLDRNALETRYGFTGFALEVARK